MKMLRILMALLSVWLSLSPAFAADCDSVIINAADAGWYNGNGTHESANKNYLCGFSGFEEAPYRDYFYFNIPPLTQTVASAVLRIYSSNVEMPSKGETFELHHVATPSATLRADSVGNANIYTDLGDGTVYGSRTFSGSDDGQYFTISLNSAFLSQLAAASGGSIAIGGTLVSIQGIYGRSEFLFGGSGLNNSSNEFVQLILSYTNSNPLTIVQQPASLTLEPGDAATFQVRVCGGGVPAYQWQRSGTNLPGATAPYLHFPNATGADAGQYRVLVGGSLSSTTVTSALATLTISNGLAPTGTVFFSTGQSPTLAGNTVVICSAISGTPAPSLQWQFNGTNLPGQTSSCLALYNVQTNQAGPYRLMASNVAGIFTSAPISLVVTQSLPSGYIYLWYGSLTPPAESSIGFCASVSGGPTPRLQWQRNGVDLPGQTNSCWSIVNVRSNDSGSYRVVASNASGVFTSAPLAVAVQYFAPTGQVYLSGGQLPAPAGSSVTFCSGAVGAPVPFIQWQRNGVNLPGQNSSCLGLANLSSTDEGQYRFIASNSVGVFTSAPVALVVNYFAPTGSIYLWTGQLPAPAGSRVGFCASISAAPPASYQWQRNGTNLPGQTLGCLDMLTVSSNDAGSYRLVAQNAYGSFTSAPIVLDVIYYAPYGSISPSGDLGPMFAGSTLSVCSFISAAPAASYQWQFNGANLAGQNSSCLYISNLQTNQSGNYRLIATNSVGSFTSAVATVSVVYRAPTARIYLSYGQIPTFVGRNLQLCAEISGAPYPSVQWQLNGTNLPLQAGTCLPFSNAQTNQSGAYTIVASNILGVVTSAVVMVSIVEPIPVLAYYSYNLPPYLIGSYASICSETTLPDVIGRQWLLNGTNLVGETNSCLSLQSVREADAGVYSVVVTTSSFLSYTSPPLAVTTYYLPPVGPYVSAASSAFVGQDVSLYAAYGGSPGFVQWYFNGSLLSGKTNQILVLLDVTTNQAGGYSFIVTNVVGAATSGVFNLSVKIQAPVWGNYSSDMTVAEGSKTRFSAYAFAGPVATYYLELNGTNVAVPYTYEGCCSESLGGFSLLDTTFADAGNYRFIASNSLGSITSAIVRLTVLPAGPLDRWTQRNPLPDSHPLLDVVYGTNQFVAVGEQGTILTSSDGADWSLQNRRTDLPLNGVAFGNGVFVAVGENGTILSSADGTNWSYRYTAADRALRAVTFGAGRFVVVGNSYVGGGTLVMHSVDGVEWERVALPGIGADRAVAYGNGMFAAAGRHSFIVSEDGINWSLTQNIINGEIEDMTYGDGRFVAVGDEGAIFVSTDGANWTARTPITSRRLLGVTYGAGRYIAAGSRGVMLESTNSFTWTPIALVTPDRLEAIDFAGGIFVAAGENGTIISSTNGTAWTQRNVGTTRDLDGMALANGTLVVVGKGGSILTSTDGTHYTVRNASVTNDLHGVFFGGGLWVAVGEPGIILISTNTIEWVNRPTDTFSSLKDGTYGDGKWIVVGTQGTVVTSSNGLDWASAQVSPLFDLNDVAYGLGVYRIVGDGPGNANGSMFTSSNGLAWSLTYPFIGKNLRSIAFYDDRFFITANDGYSVTIPAVGSISTSYQSSYNLRGSARGPGTWAEVGNYGYVFTTTNDSTASYWTLRATRTFENLHQIVYFKGRFVTVGNRGTILQSGRFVPEMDTPSYFGGTAAVPFEGVLQRGYQFQYSTNLTTWNPIFNFTNTVDRVLLADPNAGQSSFRFYRVVEP